jgi:hypothetical protein
LAGNGIDSAVLFVCYPLMRTVLILMGVLIVCAGKPAAAEAVAAAGASPTNTPQADALHLPGARWIVGERLVYRAYWGLIPVGLAVATTEWIEEDGRRLLRIRFRSRSNRILEKLYPVDDIIESVVDPVTFLPVRFEKNISEGSHRYHEVTTFDRTNNIARWQSLRSGRTRVFPIRPDTRDIPSFMYYMRSHDFKPGTREHHVIMADEKTYDLWINVGKRDTVDLPVYGDVECLKTEPEAAFEGIAVRKGRAWMWISRDARRLATRIILTLPVATAKVILHEVQGPGEDAWILKARDYRARGGDTPDADLGI